MFIQSSSIQMNSMCFSQERHTEKETFKTFGNSPNIQLINWNNEESKEDRLSLSKNAEEFLKDIQEKVKDAHKSKEDEEREILGVKNFIVKKILESFFGQEIDVVETSDIEPDGQNCKNFDETIENPEDAPPGTEYIYQETHYEYESVSFNSSGTVITEDGQQISFDLQLSMSREVYTESTFALREGGKPIDPLVINYGGSAADLTSQKFKFDLDSDGTADDISFVKPGSGFLVFDKNQDGKIKDGSELFGPSTGNGFEELARYDLDQNGWIDENDAIYDKLSIWSKKQSGEDTYQTLKQADVGAIYLAAAKTSFAYKDLALNTHGRLSQTGIYLTETGQSRLIQQLDLTA